MTVKIHSEKSRQTSVAMTKWHARKKIDKLEKALEKIYRMPTSGVRAKNVAAKALNGTDLLPFLPSFMSRVCSGYAPSQGELQTRLG